MIQKLILNVIFQQHETIKSSSESIYTGKITKDEAEEDQRNLLENVIEFNNKSRPKNKYGKGKERNTFDSLNALYECRESILNTFKSGMFPIKEAQEKGLKILTPKQMLQGLPISLAQVKVGNTPEDLLNEIRKFIYSLYLAKEITKKVYTNMMNSTKV